MAAPGFGAHCYVDAMAKYKKEFSSEQIKNAFDKFQAEAEMARTEGADLYEKLLAAGHKIFDDHEASINHEKFQFYKNLETKSNQIINSEKYKHLPNHAEEWGKASMAGTQRPIEGARYSTDAKIKTAQTKAINGLSYDLEKEKDALAYFITPEHDVEIAKAIIDPQADVPEVFRNIGKIVKKHLDISGKTLNRAGIFFRTRAERITKNMHNTDEMMKSHDKFLDRLKFRFKHKNDSKIMFETAFQRWLDFVYPDKKNSLFTEDTFGKNITYEQRVDFLREAFRTLTNAGKIEADFIKTVKKYEKPQILHFKDPESLVKYNRKMGTGSLHRSIINEIMSSHRLATIIHDWGYNPRATVDKILKKIYGRPTGEPPPEIRYTFKQRETRQVLHDLMRQLDGSLYSPTNSKATLGANVRAYTNITRLGRVMIRSIPDLAPVAQETARATGGYFQATTEALKNLFSGKTPKEKQLLHNLLNVQMTHEIGGNMRWMTTEGDNSGMMATAQKLFFRLNFMQPWDYKNRSFVAAKLSNWVASHKNLEWGTKEFGEENERIFNQYGLGKNEWDLWRKTATKMVDGQEYMTPDSILETSDEDMTKYLEKQGVRKITSQRIEDERFEIERKLRTYFTDRQDHAILTPDARDKDIWWRGTEAGTIWGEVARFASHYKLYSTAFIRKPLGRIFYGKGAETLSDAVLRGKADWKAMASLIGYAWWWGWIGMTAADLLNNKTPQSPFSLKAQINAFEWGGGAGIYGSLLTEDFGYGHSPLDWLLGPDIQNIAKGATILSKAARGKASAKEITSYTKQNIPGINLPYIKKPMDWLIFDRIQEAINPDWKEKEEAKLRKNHQRYLF